MWAASCAERFLAVFESEAPADARPMDHAGTRAPFGTSVPTPTRHADVLASVASVDGDAREWKQLRADLALVGSAGAGCLSG